MSRGKEGPVRFLICPHCGEPTPRVPVRKKEGPSASDVLFLGLFAYLLPRSPKEVCLCQNCRTIFDPGEKRIPRSHYRWIFLGLFLLTVLVVLILVLAVEW